MIAFIIFVDKFLSDDSKVLRKLVCVDRRTILKCEVDVHP